MRQRILAGIILSLTATISVAAPISGQGTWETTLQGRLPITPGGTDYQAYYDTDLNITWQANALGGIGSFFDDGPDDNDGLMNWASAQAWVGSLNAAHYLGIDNWRLPTVTDTGSPGCVDAYNATECGFNVILTSGEMAHLFYATLGNRGYYDPNGIETGCQPPLWCLTNVGPFSNFQPFGYWYGTEYAPWNDTHAWAFDFSGGAQDPVPKVIYLGAAAWAVHDGDIAAVPVPAVGWLLAPAFGWFGWTRLRASRN